jgi:serine/threonine-protein kinase
VPLSSTRRLLVAVQRRQNALLIGAGVAALCFLVTLGGLWWRQNQLARQAAAVAAVNPPGDSGLPAGEPAAATRGASGEPAAATPAASAPSEATASPSKEPEKPTDLLTSPKATSKTAPAAPPGQAVPSASGPAAQALAVLTKHCYRCHGENGSTEGGFNYVLDHEKLLARKKVIPGDPDRSKLFKKIKKGEMPPEDDPEARTKGRPTEAEIAFLQQWIAAGAPAFPAARAAAARRFISTRDMLAAVRDHLRNKVRPEDSRFQRYYTLTHLYNNPKVPLENLPLYRAALSKLINSLSWGQAMVIPTPVDPEETIYAVDLRRLNWDGRLWQAVLNVYPYGLTYDLDEDGALRDLAVEIRLLADTPLPYLRADWFIATASRPPLYHALLYDEVLPELRERPATADVDNPKQMTARDLETFLEVDLERNFLANRLVRAGFTKSGVSNNNRLVERHEARFGAYWRSYDFKSNDGTSNLLRFPLGPAFNGNPFPKQAFVQAGGELIFNLPNGLQGYLLIDGKDQRINKGPTDVVRDLSEQAGSAEIINGLACMGCHDHGVIREGWRDVILGSRTVAGDALVKVQKLFPDKEEMDKLLRRDETHFLNALDRATGRFLKVGADKDRDIRDFTREPTAAIAKLHLKGDLGPDEVARELGIEDPKELQEAIRTNRTLREKLGLGPLAQGEAIKRDAWESLAEGFSPFQQAAEELRRGRPFRTAAAARQTAPRARPAAATKARPSPPAPPRGADGYPADLPERPRP